MRVAAGHRSIVPTGRRERSGSDATRAAAIGDDGQVIASSDNHVPAGAADGRRRWVVGGVIGVVVGLLATVALRAVTDGHGGAASGGASGARATAGAAALWLFGFDTVRVDPEAFDHARRLGRPGFGEVRAYRGSVYMASRASGRVGALDAATNEMREAGGPPTDRTAGAEANLAVTEQRLWLVTGNGTVTSIRRDRFDDPDTYEAGRAGESGVTRVVAMSRRSVVVVVESPTGCTLTLLAEGERAPLLSRSMRAGGGAVRGVAAGGGHLWIVRARNLQWFDASTLSEAGSARLPSSSGAARGIAAMGDAAWVLVSNGARLLRYGAGSTLPDASVKLLADAPTIFREPAAVVAARGVLWALVRTGSGPGDHSVAVVRVDPESGSARERLDVASDLFVGAIAVT